MYLSSNLSFHLNYIYLFLICTVNFFNIFNIGYCFTILKKLFFQDHIQECSREIELWTQANTFVPHTSTTPTDVQDVII